MANQDNDPDGQDANSWVIPIPNSESPAYAVMPWPLFQRLRALANERRNVTRAQQPGMTTPVAEADDIHLTENLPQDANLDRVIPLPIQAADDLWSRSMGGIDAFDDEESENSIPLDVLERLLDGEHPLKVFRRHRALTQKQLADLTGLNATYLSQIETRKRRGSTRVYRRLATALGVDIGDLIE
jgi:DNA-binding XRE family transcriptional regulator